MLKKINIYLVLILTLVAVVPMLRPGLFNIHDDMHVAWLYEMDRALASGQFPPRFVPDLSFGFGYPLYNFVYPLPYYLGELIHLLGFNLTDSLKGVFIISLVGGALAMYKLLREYTNSLLSLTGAVIYTFTPYRAVDIYVRGAVGEALSFLFLPLIAWSVVKLTNSSKEDNLRFIGVGGLAVAALMLTHNITAFMFLPVVVLLGLLRICFEHEESSARLMSAAGLIKKAAG